MLRHSIVKLLKTKEKTVLKITREKPYLINNIFQMLKDKFCQPRNLCPVKILFREEETIYIL